MLPPLDTQRVLEDLKISVLARGIRVDTAALDSLGGPKALTTHEYATTGGIPMQLEHGVYLNAPFDDWYCDTSTVELTTDSEGYVLSHAGHRFPITKVFPLPGYLAEADAEGNRYDEVAYSHLDRVRLSPITGCAYDCAFCDLPGRIELRSVDRLLEAARIALEDQQLPARHLLISGGSPGPRQHEEFAKTVGRLVNELGSRTEVDVMMSSGPGTADLVRQLVDCGVHGFALNIELESDSAAQLHIRSKHRWARPHFDKTVATAVELLGRTGRVRSLIIPGLEPPDGTIAGIEHLATLGADPVLSPFRPAIGTRLEKHEPVNTELLREVLDRARPIVEAHEVRLGPRCLPCQHNTLTFPWDVG